jgi:hypothetical protein
VPLKHYHQCFYGTATSAFKALAGALKALVRALFHFLIFASLRHNLSLMIGFVRSVCSGLIFLGLDKPTDNYLLLVIIPVAAHDGRRGGVQFLSWREVPEFFKRGTEAVINPKGYKQLREASETMRGKISMMNHFAKPEIFPC